MSERICTNFVKAFKDDYRVCWYFDKYLEDDSEYIADNSVMLTNVMIQKILEDSGVLYNNQKAEIEVNEEDISDFTYHVVNNNYLNKLIKKYIRENGLYGKSYEIGYYIATEFLCMVEKSNDELWRCILDKE